MLVIFEGKSTKVTYDEFCDMSMYFCGLLLEPDDIDDLELTISFEVNLAVRNWNGFCQTGNSDNQFLIWIRRSKSAAIQAEVLAHELVHVKQYIRREMADDGLHSDPVLRSWGGCGSYDENTVEIEAFGRTHGLINRYNLYKQEKIDV